MPHDMHQCLVLVLEGCMNRFDMRIGQTLQTLG